MWRYRELLPFDASAPAVTLFEGNTPLYDAPRSAEYSGLAHLRVKNLGCNPTGSFKDTGMTVTVIQAALLGAHTVVCASTGNTAAIVTGISLASAVAGRKISADSALRYAAELEGHADNVAAAMLGSLVITAIREDGSVIAIRRDWPTEIRIVAVDPDFVLETRKARAVLPSSVSHEIAVHNLQRSALLLAALEEKQFDLLWDALQDRVHRRCRESLIPGLADILRIPRASGLLGIALSGSGPSVIALANDHFDKIGKSIARCFQYHHLAAAIHVFAVAAGQIIAESNPPVRK